MSTEPLNRRIKSHSDHCDKLTVHLSSKLSTHLRDFQAMEWSVAETLMQSTAARLCDKLFVHLVGNQNPDLYYLKTDNAINRLSIPVYILTVDAYLYMYEYNFLDP